MKPFGEIPVPQGAKDPTNGPPKKPFQVRHLGRHPHVPHQHDGRVLIWTQLVSYWVQDKGWDQVAAIIVYKVIGIHRHLQYAHPRLCGPTR
jgi:hypothetical protein